ncbi:hypothetical protein A2707_00955 [Candidatus Saccharibacteria bacterium RIFCSPHIGHO2_01_FULL_45_15]|nr:MAG: hypothetical protein A2707_00955 [Candidatus Saccharibacteria bacterium RIFCSPHIGHO2_01_FULL_45_15]OGL26941.1 MAG: hypothetical protein A3C39_02070 [Candidatus Saccharibacteria bacterium RIFCSPHIGHO2_02_FULL_46_12]OGL32294.1 MAG: hypothetical protein A3E76_02775 [Candidatus Saccharibacteria bacterium RIFCSPHIGHO2_12_FULL_44_22]
MSWTRNIYDQTDKPVGRTTLRKLIVAFIIFIIPVVAFAYIADEVVEGDTMQIDTRILLGIYHQSTPVLNEIVLHITGLGGVLGVAGLTAAAIGIFMYRSRWQSCLQIAAGVAGAALLNVALKLIFERDRPNLWQHLIFENSYSFPSGHAMLSSALAFSFVVVMWHTRWRWITFSIATFYVIAIGFTRLYLGVHYPTDVLAGWCVSAAWVIVVAVVLGSFGFGKRGKKLKK